MVHVKREEGEAKRMHAGVAFYCSCQCLHVPVSVNRAGNARHTLWRRRTSSARASTIPAGKGQAKRSCAQNSRAWKCRRYEVFLAWKRRAFSLCGAGCDCDSNADSDCDCDSVCDCDCDCDSDCDCDCDSVCDCDTGN